MINLLLSDIYGTVEHRYLADLVAVERGSAAISRVADPAAGLLLVQRVEVVEQVLEAHALEVKKVKAIISNFDSILLEKLRYNKRLVDMTVLDIFYLTNLIFITI